MGGRGRHDDGGDRPKRRADPGPRGADVADPCRRIRTRSTVGAMPDALRPSGSSTPVSQHTIAGTVLTMPVEIRKATQHMAMFSVDADAAQQMIDYSGLQVCRFIPGRAVVVLMLMHYVDGDL